MLKRTEPAWERWGKAITAWVPYVTLAVAALLSLVQPGLTVTSRLRTALLVAFAAAWVFAMFTSAPEPRGERPARMAVYFVGLLALASGLLVRQPIFFLFMITGFFHASILRPWPVAVLGVAATSFLVNTLIAGFPRYGAVGWCIYLAIIVVQTVVIGFGAVAKFPVATDSPSEADARPSALNRAPPRIDELFPPHRSEM